MKLDPVLAEIRKVREAYSEKFNGDIRAMAADIRARQKSSGHHIVSRPSKPIPDQSLPSSR
jgi:hypothetical protein